MKKGFYIKTYGTVEIVHSVFVFNYPIMNRVSNYILSEDEVDYFTELDKYLVGVWRVKLTQ